MHAGGAVMNPVLMVLMGAALVLAGALRSKRRHEGLAVGLAWARFPSLMAFPVMLFLQPTVMCACTLIFHGSAGMKAVGAVVLILCVATPVATWGAPRAVAFPR